MEKPIILSERVINTLKSLAPQQRKAIAWALMDDIVLGEGTGNLSPLNAMLYAMIAHYVRQDSSRMNNEGKTSSTTPFDRPTRMAVAF
ncbi:MAG: hypothetical protein LIP02_03220 [Bacteroidales bacterium]|nr:hypothetical protein [Bacteroidales bacterium]